MMEFASLTILESSLKIRRSAVSLSENFKGADYFVKAFKKISTFLISVTIASIGIPLQYLLNSSYSILAYGYLCMLEK
jgi:hypothetical protein